MKGLLHFVLVLTCLPLCLNEPAAEEDVLPPVDLSLPSRLEHQLRDIKASVASVAKTLQALPEAVSSLITGVCSHSRAMPLLPTGPQVNTAPYTCGPSSCRVIMFPCPQANTASSRYVHCQSSKQ